MKLNFQIVLKIFHCWPKLECLDSSRVSMRVFWQCSSLVLSWYTCLVKCSLSEKCLEYITVYLSSKYVPLRSRFAPSCSYDSLLEFDRPKSVAVMLSNNHYSVRSAVARAVSLPQLSYLSSLLRWLRRFRNLRAVVDVSICREMIYTDEIPLPTSATDVFAAEGTVSSDRLTPAEPRLVMQHRHQHSAAAAAANSSAE